jgi:hypothetical protein
MPETAVEAKREVDETRAHLDQTIHALQQQTRRTFDVKTQVRTNRQLQISLGGIAAVVVGLVALGIVRGRRRSGADRLLRKLKLNDVRQRLGDLGEDARAWSAAQKRLVRASSKSEEAELERRQGIARRLIVKAAEAALTALAASYAKKFIDRATGPRLAHTEAAKSA